VPPHFIGIKLERHYRYTDRDFRFVCSGGNVMAAVLSGRWYPLAGDRLYSFQLQLLIPSNGIQVKLLRQQKTMVFTDYFA